MNIAIIGCGYVGTAVAHHCRWNLGYHVTATTTTPERVADLNKVAQRVVVLQASDEKALQALLQQQDAVFLSIAPTGNQQVSSEIYEQTYLDTAKKLVAILQQSSSVQQLIYTSSCAVYGDQDGAWVDEAFPVAPGTKNGEILYDTEQVLLSVSREDLKVCIFRLATIYGPNRELKKRFVNLAGTTRPGTGNYFTNWIHLEDIVSAAGFVLSHPLQGIFNLVNDGSLTASELFDRLSQRYNLPKVEWDPTLPRTKANNRRISNQKLKAQGYQFLHAELEI